MTAMAGHLPFLLWEATHGWVCRVTAAFREENP